MLRTYRKLDRTVIDISGLEGEDLAFFERLYAHWRDRSIDWIHAGVDNHENPLVRAAGIVTNAVWAHPMYQAAKDLQYRIGILAGGVAADEGSEDPALDPIETSTVSVREAAVEKGVTVSAIHGAIARRELLAAAAKPGGAWKVISRASLARWHPAAVRQQAGRARQAARSA